MKWSESREKREERYLRSSESRYKKEDWWRQVFFFFCKREITYSIFFGFMTKHQRVHISPVAVRARFCVKERFSAGRQKSLTPARTRAHCY